MFTIFKLLTLLYLVLIIICSQSSQQLSTTTTTTTTILNIPLDERFTTRIAFLNMAKITPFQVISLPQQYLPSIKKYNNPQEILTWLQQKTKQKFTTNKQQINYIISLETILYGSLIASRISNDTYETIVQDRLSKLIKLKSQYKNVNIYLSAVVMRIPNYNLDFQQPEYWSQYGQLLYTYSYYLDKYNTEFIYEDLQTATNAKKQIPSNVLAQFIWRRNRNHFILLHILEELGENRELFKALYITLDDNAKYGFNIDEAKQLGDKVKELKLDGIVKIYPGADEVSLSLLAKFSCDYVKVTPIVAMYFRNSSTINYIPNYQGLPLIETMQQQIISSGATPVNGTLLKRGNITLLINNFNSLKQIQAPYQQKYQDQQSPNYNETLWSPLCYPGQKQQIYGFIDNRYSNGADLRYLSWIIQSVKACKRNMQRWGYAGWNTNGNTIGTVVANTVVLFASRLIKQKQKNSFFKNEYNLKISQQIRSQNSIQSIVPLIINDEDCPYCSPCPKNNIPCNNIYFNLLRVLQDRDWQAILRQKLIQYITEVPGDSYNNLQTDLEFYTKYSYKSMTAKFVYLQKQLDSVMGNVSFQLSGIYYPWNRTFQIGLYGRVKGEKEYNQLKQL